jgi:hypothetical protein
MLTFTKTARLLSQKSIKRTLAGNGIKEIREKYYKDIVDGHPVVGAITFRFTSLLLILSFFWPGADNPTYLKHPGDRLIVFAAAGFIFFGLGNLVYGLGRGMLGLKLR